MQTAFDHLAKQVLDLPARQRLKLAEVLLISADGELEEGSEAAWNAEIHDRIIAIDSGLDTGIPLAEVMAEADNLLAK